MWVGGGGTRHVCSPKKKPQKKPKLAETGSSGTAWLAPRHSPLLVSVTLQTG